MGRTICLRVEARFLKSIANGEKILTLVKRELNEVRQRVAETLDEILKRDEERIL